jgi:hypothetical protein
MRWEKMRADFKLRLLLDRVKLSKPHFPFFSVSMLDMLFPMAGDPTPSPGFNPIRPKGTQFDPSTS